MSQGEMTTEEACYPIGYVSRSTGLSPHLIRAWEKRYNVVSPQRSDSNRRLYTHADLMRLRRLSALCAKGHRISLIAALDQAGLERLSMRSEGENRTLPSSIAHELSAEHWIAAAMGAVERMDVRKLDRVLKAAAVELGRLKLMSDVISPLFARIGRKWAAGDLRVGQEHAATNALQGFLWNLLTAAGSPDGAPGMLAATPPGQRCTLGALMAAVVAADRGWRVHYLGAELAADELAAAAAKVGAVAMCLSLALVMDSDIVKRYFADLREAVGNDTVIHAGGAGAAACRAPLESLGVRLHPNLSYFAESITAVSSGA